jgi:WD40 repeat protein
MHVVENPHKPVDLSRFDTSSFRGGNVHEFIQQQLHNPDIERNAILSREGFLDVVMVPDGQRVLTWSQGMSLKLWDLNTKQCLYTLSESSDLNMGFGNGWEQGDIATGFSDDCRFALNWRVREGLKLWDLSSGQCVQILKGQEQQPQAIVFSQNMLALTDDFPMIKMWDLRTGEMLRALTGHASQTSALAISPNGRIALSGTSAPSSSSLKLWDLETGRCMRTLEESARGIRAVTFTSDSQEAVSVNSGGVLTVWRLDVSRCKKAPFQLCIPRSLRDIYDEQEKIKHALSIASTLFTDGKAHDAWKTLLSAWDLIGFGRDLRFDNLYEQIRAQQTITYPLSVTGQTIHAHNAAVAKAYLIQDKSVALSSQKGAVKLWNLKTGELLREISGRKLIKFHPLGSVSVYDVISTAGGLRGLLGSLPYKSLWDLDNGEFMHKFEGDFYVHLSEKGDKALTRSLTQRNVVKIRDASTGNCLDKHTDFPEAFRICHATLTSNEWRVLVWDREDMLSYRDLISNLPLWSHQTRVHRFLLPQDKRRVLIFDTDDMVSLFDFDTSMCLWTKQSPSKEFSETPLLEITQDGRRAVSLDQRLRVWDMDTGKSIYTVDLASVGTSLTLTPDGDWALSGHADGTIIYWRIIWNLR